MGVPGQNRTDFTLGQRRQQAGFTLIEVMIVVAIVGITSVIAVPNYLIWYARHQLTQAAMEITSQLAVSRLAAMTRNSTTSTTVAIGSGQLIMTATNASGGSVYTQMTEIPHVSTVTFLSGTNIQFSPLGLRTSAGAGDQVIGITNDRGLQYSVRVTQGGKAIWCPKASCP